MAEAVALLPNDIINDFIENWANLRLAHEGLMVDRVQRLQRQAEKMADMAATGEVGPISPTDEEEKNMAVSIGNKIFLMQPGTAESSPAPPPAPTPTPPPVVVHPEVIKPDIVKPEVVNPVFAPIGNGSNKLLPIIAVALGVLGATGIGAGALALWQRWTDKPSIAAPIAYGQDLKFGISVSDKP